MFVVPEETALRKHQIADFSLLAVFLALGLAGCDYNGNSTADQRAREERTRDEVAKATERAKPALEEAGRKIGKAASEAADQAQAAAEGVRDGWDRGGHHLVNVNAASEDELAELPGIGHREARRIIEGVLIRIGMTWWSRARSQKRRTQKFEIASHQNSMEG